MKDMNKTEINCLSDVCQDIETPKYAQTSGHCVNKPENPIKVDSVCTVMCKEGCLLSDGSNSANLKCIENNGNTVWNESIPESCLPQTQCQSIGPIEFGSGCDPTVIDKNCTF